jgi:hypothetical protein
MISSTGHVSATHVSFFLALRSRHRRLVAAVHVPLADRNLVNARWLERLLDTAITDIFTIARMIFTILPLARSILGRDFAKRSHIVAIMDENAISEDGILLCGKGTGPVFYLETNHFRVRGVEYDMYR